MDRRKLCWSVSLIFVVMETAVSQTESPVSDERRLVNSLMSKYSDQGKVARPVADPSSCIDVQFGIRLVHLDLDEKEQIMKTSVWVRMVWTDNLLQWDPSEYSGLTSVIIPADKVWIPDLALVNTAETTVKEHAADVVVKYNGIVFWAPQRKYQSACLIDVTEYPYDKHTCEMWFQSMSNRGSHLNITAYPKSPVDLDTYLSSYRDAQEWDILANETTWHERPRDVGMILMWSRRPSLRFSLTVQRRAGFKGMLLIVPCTLLSFIIPLIFCLPPERPDRHTLAMSVFGSLTILLFMVTEVAPPSASFVPRLALYYCFNLLILLLATCCSTIVVNLSKRGETREKVPKVVKKVFINALGTCLCFGRKLEHLSEINEVTKKKKDSISNDDTTEHPKSARGQEPQQAVPESFPSQSLNSCKRNSITINMDEAATQWSALNGKLDDICVSLSRLEVGHKPEDRKASTSVEVRMEWRTLSLVLDRFFFVVYLIINFISLGAFYPRNP